MREEDSDTDKDRKIDGNGHWKNALANTRCWEKARLYWLSESGSKPPGGRQLASIAAFLHSPSTILIDMACLRTIHTSNPSTDHQFLVGSIEVRLMHGIAISKSVAKLAEVKKMFIKM
jgi:hypothetical protein